MTETRFDNGITVTIRDGWLAAPTPELTAILDTNVVLGMKNPSSHLLHENSFR